MPEYKKYRMIISRTVEQCTTFDVKAQDEVLAEHFALCRAPYLKWPPDETIIFKYAVKYIKEI